MNRNAKRSAHAQRCTDETETSCIEALGNLHLHSIAPKRQRLLTFRCLATCTCTALYSRANDTYSRAALTRAAACPSESKMKGRFKAPHPLMTPSASVAARLRAISPWYLRHHAYFIAHIKYSKHPKAESAFGLLSISRVSTRKIITEPFISSAILEHIFRHFFSTFFGTLRWTPRKTSSSVSDTESDDDRCD